LSANHLRGWNLALWPEMSLSGWKRAFGLNPAQSAGGEGFLFLTVYP
jgi:hypothetical protein